MPSNPSHSQEWQPGEPLRTTDEVARILRVAPETIREYARRGRLQGLKIGQEYRFRDAWVAAFIAGRQRQDTGRRQDQA